MYRYLFLAGVAILTLYTLLPPGMRQRAAAATCPLQTASNSLIFKSDKQRTNIGVVPTGFVNPSDGSAAVHGIDVSKYQTDPIFAGVRDCGGAFAYIRLSAGTEPNNELSYRTFWANAKSVGLLTGPYHHLTLADTKSALHDMGKADVDALARRNVRQSTIEAQLFKKRLIELLGYDPRDEQSPGRYGAPYLPAALDATETPQASSSAADRQQFGAVYGQAICAWVKEFQSDDQFKDQPVILFTKPFVFRDYRLADAPCDLARLKVWISYHSRSGDRPTTETEPIFRKAINDLCITSDGNNRCVLEQYTSYGGFAVYYSAAGLDLDRYTGTIASFQEMLQRAIAK